MGDHSKYDALVDIPLHKAIRDGDPVAVRALLAAGLDPNGENFDGLVPLSTLATTSSSVDIAQMLLNAGADPNGLHSPLPPLVVAASQGRRDLVNALLNVGADFNITDEDEYTALMYSLIRKDCELAAQLLSLGADFTRTNRYGRDARYYAEEAGCQDIIKQMDELSNRGL